MFNKCLGTNPILLGPGIKTGLSVNIDNPKELGPDRIANSVGGIHKVGAPLIVIDMGTATKYDVINSRGVFIGGVIRSRICTSQKLRTSLYYFNMVVI